MKKITFIIFVGFLIGAFILSPLQVGVLTSNSMSPTIEQSETFLFIETTDVNEGDIVIFYQNDQQVVTHRIVHQTENGYITKGDNNPTTDQNAGNPPLRETNIIGKAIEIGGSPVKLPFIGLEQVQFIDENKIYFFSFIIILIILDLTIFDKKKFKENQGITYGKIINTLFLILVIISSIFLFIPTTQTDNFVVNTEEVENQVEFSSTFNKNVFQSGNYSTQIYTVDGSKINNIEQSKNAISVEHGPYNEIGPQRVKIKIHSYPNIFPPGLIKNMHSIHPIVPSFFIPLSSMTIFYLISVILLPISEKVYMPRIKSSKNE